MCQNFLCMIYNMDIMHKEIFLLTKDGTYILMEIMIKFGVRKFRGTIDNFNRH
jgi:hypothetical protein